MAQKKHIIVARESQLRIEETVVGITLRNGKVLRCKRPQLYRFTAFVFPDRTSIHSDN